MGEGNVRFCAVCNSIGMWSGETILFLLSTPIHVFVLIFFFFLIILLVCSKFSRLKICNAYTGVSHPLLEADLLVGTQQEWFILLSVCTSISGWCFLQ